MSIMSAAILAWHVDEPGTPPRARRVAVPEPAAGEVLVRVLTCGVCRTDLHVADGDLPVHRVGVVPGHEVVGEVVDSVVPGFTAGDRVGIPWLRWTCGECRYCRGGRENLCPRSRYTGWDEDGGYAEYAVVPAGYALALPPGYDAVELAPLLCAGVIGYHALLRSAVPDGGVLGVYGLGASAHLATQVALARGMTVHVMTRSAAARELATGLGAASSQGAADAPPEPLDGAILFAPAGELVPPALAALDRGGTLALAGIHLTEIPPLDYRRHLFQDRALLGVTANTRDQAREFLAFAAGRRLHVETTPYPLGRADAALTDLRADRVTGAAVLIT